MIVRINFFVAILRRRNQHPQKERERSNTDNNLNKHYAAEFERLLPSFAD